jgi:hypothetical protein
MIDFICPKCVRWVEGEIKSNARSYFTSCPICGMNFDISIKVNIPESTVKYIASERLKRLQREYCEFDGVGYVLKKEYWETALRDARVEYWGHGEDGYAYLSSIIRIQPEERPPEPFWGAHYFALGSFQECHPEDTTNPAKIKQLYVVKDEKEARFIQRAKIRR